MFKRLYLFFILFLFSGCAVITPTDIESLYVGVYRSIDVVMPEKYLWVKVEINAITVYFGDTAAKNPGKDAVKISGENAISGLDPNYSFQSGTVVGHLSFSERELYITYVSSSSDSKDTIALHNVKCVKQEGN